jgi:hypothetical protein
VYNKNTKRNTIHIDVLHIVDEDNNGHFVYIKDFEKSNEFNYFYYHKAYLEIIIKSKAQLIYF